MLKTEQPVPRAGVADKRPERIAWAILFAGFAIFCVVGIGGSVLAYRWWTRPPLGVIRAEVDQSLAVRVQRAGLVRLELLEDGKELNPGDRIAVSAEATPGAAATLRFGSAAVALWGGTNMQLGTFGRQWNDPTTARLQMDSGQMLLEINQDDQRIEVSTGPDSRPIVLQGRGRYRVRIIEKTSPTTAIIEQDETRGVEIATERGLASIGSVEIKPGQRLVEVLGEQQPRRTQWELIRDGTFQGLVDWVFRRSDVAPPWSSTVQPTAEGAAETGQVRPTQMCLDPLNWTDCEEPYLRLVRMGGNDKGFSTAIAQQIDADVASYQQVRLKARIKVVSQSLSQAGESGTECPLLIRVNYMNNAGRNLQKDYCFWAFDHPGRNGVISNLPYISTKQLPPDTWYDFDVDLKEQIPNLVKIHEVSFQANGHDYESQISTVQLTAEGLAEIPAR